MKNKLRFSKEAKLEFDEAINYYNNEQLGLGDRFKAEIKFSINNILKFPNLYPIIQGEVRKCVTHTFPFTIFYKLKDETIYILAIANHHKNPNFYSKRF